MFANTAGYESMTGRWSARLAPLFLRFAQIGNAGRVLDVGCGTGSPVRILAAASPQVEIVGIDPAEDFIDYARAQFGDSRITFERADALDLPYPPASFDHVLSLLVLMFIPEPAKAAMEMRRVTCPGGTVAACTWASQRRNTVFWEEAAALDPLFEARSERPRDLNRFGQLTALWHATGLQHVEEEALEISMDFSSFDDYWQPYLAGVGPNGLYVSGLSPDRRERLRNAIRTRLLGDGPDHPFSLEAKALAVRGIVLHVQ